MLCHRVDDVGEIGGNRKSGGEQMYLIATLDRRWMQSIGGNRKSGGGLRSSLFPKNVKRIPEKEKASYIKSLKNKAKKKTIERTTKLKRNSQSESSSRPTAVTSTRPTVVNNSGPILRPT
jgi:hypothetical protein